MSDDTICGLCYHEKWGHNEQGLCDLCHHETTHKFKPMLEQIEEYIVDAIRNIKNRNYDDAIGFLVDVRFFLGKIENHG